MSSQAKMLGRLGWHGQCDCCCGQDGKDQVRAREKREVAREAVIAIVDRRDCER
jgi:hypothetical protein